jgi:ribosomal-protein-alanine acetyltransferase
MTAAVSAKPAPVPVAWEIRPLRAGDVEAVYELERRTEGAAHWNAEEYLRILEPVAPRGVRRIGTVALVRGRLVGFAAGRLVLGEAEIENIAVDAEHRRRGVASALVQGLVEQCRARKASVVRLEVRESNESAQELYLRAGFKQDGRRNAYYTNPDEAALLLSRKL